MTLAIFLDIVSESSLIEHEIRRTKGEEVRSLLYKSLLMCLFQNICTFKFQFQTEMLLHARAKMTDFLLWSTGKF